MTGENTYPRELPAMTPGAYKAHLRAEDRLSDAAAGKVELAGDEAAKLKASMFDLASIRSTPLYAARISDSAATGVR